MSDIHEFSQFKILNHMDRIQGVLDGELPPPVTLEIDPTNACNHNCRWCIDARHRKSNPEMLKLEAALSIIDQARKMGVRSLVVKGGGEPLIYRHIEKLLLHAHEVGFETGIITNGEKILEHRDVIEKTCTWLRISLDAGSSDVHEKVHRPKNPGAFEKICQGIKAVSEKVFCGVIYIIHPMTFHEMGIAARRVKALGSRYIGFKRVIADSELFDAETLLSIEANYLFARRQNECADFKVMGFHIYNFRDGKNRLPYEVCLGHHLIGILCANGEIYACCSTRGNPDYSFGNIYENSFEDIWNGKRRKAVLEKISKGACKNLCVGHTSYMRYDHYNELFKYLLSGEKPHRNFL